MNKRRRCSSEGPFEDMDDAVELVQRIVRINRATPEIAEYYEKFRKFGKMRNAAKEYEIIVGTLTGKKITLLVMQQYSVEYVKWLIFKKRRHSARQTEIDICRQAIVQRRHDGCMQHSKTIDSALGSSRKRMLK